MEDFKYIDYLKVIHINSGASAVTRLFPRLSFCIDSFLMKRFCIQQGISIFLAAICFLSIYSCNKKAKQEEVDKESGISRNYQRGPVNLTLFVSEKEITVADRLKLTIQVVSVENYEIELPEFEKSLERFAIVDYKAQQAELVGKNKKKIKCSYLLEPFLSGDYTIPSMKVKFRKKDGAGDETGEIETDAMTIRVTSLLSGKMEDLKLHEIRPPVAIPRSYAFLIWIVIAIVAVSAVIFAVMLRRRKRTNQGTVDEYLSAHVIAFSELEELARDRLPEKGEVKIFYHRISNILRRYIEKRFGLRAPEQTTEEFLAGFDADTNLDKSFKPLLRKFLVQCDLVKFAEHRPAGDDIDKTFDNCRAFISKTKEDEIEKHLYE